MIEVEVVTTNGQYRPPGCTHLIDRRSLTPGKAILIDRLTNEYKIISVDAKVCKAAVSDDCLHWRDNRTWATFQLDGQLLAQPLTGTKSQVKRKAQPPPAEEPFGPTRHRRSRSAWEPL